MLVLDDIEVVLSVLGFAFFVVDLEEDDALLLDDDFFDELEEDDPTLESSELNSASFSPDRYIERGRENESLGEYWLCFGRGRFILVALLQLLNMNGKPGLMPG